jgi:hypothetical protein
MDLLCDLLLALILVLAGTNSYSTPRVLTGVTDLLIACLTDTLSLLMLP